MNNIIQNIYLFNFILSLKVLTFSGSVERIGFQGLSKIVNLCTGLRNKPLLVLTSVTLTLPSSPGYILITRPRTHFMGGVLSSCIRTSVLIFIFFFGADHRIFCISSIR